MNHSESAFHLLDQYLLDGLLVLLPEGLHGLTSQWHHSETDKNSVSSMRVTLEAKSDMLK